jgi:hypothetical protein
MLLSNNFDGLLLLFSLNLRNLFGCLCFVHYLHMREWRVFSFYAILGNFLHDIKQVTINFESNGDVFALKRDSYAQ